METKIERERIEGPTRPPLGYFVKIAKGQVKDVCPISGQTPIEDVFNVLTHGAAFLVSLPLTLSLLLPNVLSDFNPTSFTSLCFAVAVTGMFGTSSLYHICRGESSKRYVRGWDHALIYFVISATFAALVSIGPISLKSLSLCLVVTGACLGLGLAEINGKRFNRVISTAIYCSIVLSTILSAANIVNSLSVIELCFLVSGILSYAFGVWFYLRRDLAFHHTIWHLFVIGGVFFHALVIF